MSGHYYPPQGSGGSSYWGDAVATFASLPTGIVNGEIRETIDTRNLYYWNGSAWVLLLNAGGAVVGPASATDNALVRFDGTTGKLIKNSVAILTDSGNLSGVVNLTVTGLTTLATSLTGFLKGASGVVSSQASIVLTSDVSGVLPVASGGTNSSTALANNFAMISAAGKIVESAVTSTELGYLAGVTSSIQTQLNARALNSRLINTTAPLTGGGDLSADRTIAMPAATTSVNGYLTSTDWNTFNGKQASGNYITALTGDVTASGPGSVAATIAAGAVTNAKIVAAAGISLNKLAAVTASRAVVSDGSGFLTQATTTATEIGFVNGVTSAIQTQLDAKLCATTTVNVSSNVTLTDKAIHYVSTASARSLTLPSPTAARFLVIKDSTGSAQTNNITIVRAASEKIETVAASYVLDSNLGSWTFVSDGTDWFII